MRKVLALARAAGRVWILSAAAVALVAGHPGGAVAQSLPTICESFIGDAALMKCQATFDGTQAAPGVYSLTFGGTDEWGNAADPVTATAVIDNPVPDTTKPVVENVSVTKTGPQSWAITWDVRDDRVATGGSVTAAPTPQMATLFTDAFTGTSADLGANWTVAGPFGTWERVSDAAEPAALGDDSVEYVNSVSAPDDQWAQVKVTTNNGNADNNFNGGGPAVRLATDGTTFYAAVVKNDRVVLIRRSGGTFTAIGTPFSTTWNDGDTLYIEAVDDQITVKINGTTRIGPVTDATIASGSFGIAYGSTVTSLSCDDYEAGDFTAGATTWGPLIALRNNRLVGTGLVG